MNGLDSVFWLGALPLITAGAGAYLGSYLKEKGKHLATHEDLDQIIEQLKSTTEATKRIENRISDEFWNKQRVWELRRDVLRSALAAIAGIDSPLDVLDAIRSTFANLQMVSPETQKTESEAWTALNNAQDVFNLVLHEIAVVGSPTVYVAFDTLRDGYGQVLQVLLKWERYDQRHRRNIQNLRNAVIRSIRVELGMSVPSGDPARG